MRKTFAALTAALLFLAACSGRLQEAACKAASDPGLQESDGGVLLQKSAAKVFQCQ